MRHTVPLITMSAIARLLLSKTERRPRTAAVMVPHAGATIASLWFAKMIATVGSSKSGIDRPTVGLREKSVAESV